MRKLVIDTDCGLDDASAIMMALSDPGTQVLAVTTVDGNTCLDNVVQNVLRALRAADRLDIPVYRGASCSLLNARSPQPCHHGKDELGDYEDHEPVNWQMVQKEHAVAAILRIVHEHQDVELVCLGPLTNLALAVRMDPGLGSRLKHIGIMGGNYKGWGNITMTSEFNFYRDPEAAHIVLSDLTGPAITMVGWEVCYENRMTPERVQPLMQADTKKAAFARNIHVKATRDPQSPDIIFCHEVAVACLLNAGVATESASVRFRVELGGHRCRGLAVPDWEGVGTGSHQPLVTVVTKIDRVKFLDLLRRSLEG